MIFLNEVNAMFPIPLLVSFCGLFLLQTIDMFSLNKMKENLLLVNLFIYFLIGLSIYFFQISGGTEDSVFYSNKEILLFSKSIMVLFVLFNLNQLVRGRQPIIERITLENLFLFLILSLLQANIISLLIILLPCLLLLILFFPSLLSEELCSEELFSLIKWPIVLTFILCGIASYILNRNSSLYLIELSEIFINRQNGIGFYFPYFVGSLIFILFIFIPMILRMTFLKSKVQNFLNISCGRMIFWSLPLIGVVLFLKWSSFFADKWKGLEYPWNSVGLFPLENTLSIIFLIILLVQIYFIFKAKSFNQFLISMFSIVPIIAGMAFLIEDSWGVNIFINLVLLFIFASILISNVVDDGSLQLHSLVASGGENSLKGLSKEVILVFIALVTLIASISFSSLKLSKLLAETQFNSSEGIVTVYVFVGMLSLLAIVSVMHAVKFCLALDVNQGSILRDNNTLQRGWNYILLIALIILGISPIYLYKYMNLLL